MKGTRLAALSLFLLACSGGGRHAGDADADAEADVPRDPAGEEAADGEDFTVEDGDADPGACEAPALPEGGFHVTTSGSASGDGSVAAPWDLATALAGPPAVRPWDTIWIHGGTYEGEFTSGLEGTPGAPITVRAVPGETVVLDGAAAPPSESVLAVDGAWAVFRDLEVTVSSDENCTETRPKGVNVVGGPGISLVHLVIHDTANVGFWQGASDSVMEGCIVYNNGWPGSALGHNLYTQNREGKKRIAGNVFFDAYGFGIHAYGSEGLLVGYEIVGNVWFNNGVAQPDGDRKDNCLVGGTTYPAEGIVLEDNLGWAPGPGERSVRLGWGVPNTDVTLRGNYFVGQTIFAQPWSSVTMTGNTFYGDVTGVDTAAYPDNAYLAERPAETRVFLRPSSFEPGRAFVVVYNWAGLDAVDADLGGLLPHGTIYEVRSAQAPAAPPVAEGTFDGSPLHLPLVASPPAPPVCSPGGVDPSEETGEAFFVFLVRPLGCAP